MQAASKGRDSGEYEKVRLDMPHNQRIRPSDWVRGGGGRRVNLCGVNIRHAPKE